MGDTDKRMKNLLWQIIPKIILGLLAFLLLWLVNGIRGGIDTNEQALQALQDTVENRFNRTDTCILRSIHIDTSLQGQIVRLSRRVEKLEVLCGN